MRHHEVRYISHEGCGVEVKFAFKKKNLKIVLILMVVFVIVISIGLGANLVINKIREGVVRGTLELRDYPNIYENHSTQPVWVIVALEDIYPPLVYYLTEDDELITSIEKHGDFGEGDLVTADGVIHSKQSYDGLTKYLFLEVETIQQGIVWGSDHNYGFVIKDMDGDTLEVENNNMEAQERAENMRESGEWRWIGGKVVTHDNEWGFRFDPDTITIADSADERFKTNLQSIKINLDHWLQFERVFVWAKVTHLLVEHGISHEPSL